MLIFYDDKLFTFTDIQRLYQKGTDIIFAISLLFIVSAKSYVMGNDLTIENIYDERFSPFFVKEIIYGHLKFPDYGRENALLSILLAISFV